MGIVFSNRAGCFKTVGESVEQKSQALKFYEVDAPGDDYVDFGAYTGPHGSFSWHANYPLEK